MCVYTIGINIYKWSSLTNVRHFCIFVVLGYLCEMNDILLFCPMYVHIIKTFVLINHFFIRRLNILRIIV